MKKNMMRLVLCLCCLVWLPSSGIAKASEKQAEMAFLPFTINSAKDMSYLREGMREMLISRLSAEAGIAVVDKAKVDAALKASGGSLAADKVAEFTKKVGADYLMYGSVTALGGGMSFDAKVYSTAKNESETFYATATSEGEVMSAIDSLSWDVAAGVFGKKRPAKYAAVRADEPAASPYETAHPDRTYMKSGGNYGGASSKWIDGGQRFVKASNVDLALEAMAVGDVDGDGILDVVMADRQYVTAYHLNNNRLNEFAKTKLPARYKIHAVNVADLNNNGKSEIYVSAADTSTPGSWGLEWNGTELTTLFAQARFYIRPLMVPGFGTILAGQRSGKNAKAIGGPLYSLIQDGDKLVVDEVLPLPETLVIFNFAIGDLDGDSDWEIVVLDEFSKLRVMEPGGKMLWKSQEYYGATKRFVGGENLLNRPTSRDFDELTDGKGEQFLKIWVPSRIIIKDMDQDGIDDVILNKNASTLTTVVREVQTFPYGTAMGLKWNGLGLEEIWQTKRIDGYVVDYELESQHHKTEDGEDRLYVGVVTQGGVMNMLSGDTSTLLIYPFKAKTEEDSK
ncbi:MAG: VCBS repeat-containing protein [Proteobacteria bacterium]|nr:VCBS repeat-containing protein [Pseudomonadota bacterium]MBU1233198.1 VCBS repeat-containing protein [Pseudomonadota bacterium]MBU1416863.1 VCBS repeat-containing protein [Pseudomonadota bacterium]MBU1454693.1 VCBS repeat-containing protein [Pseudomonadota bacterium]